MAFNPPFSFSSGRPIPRNPMYQLYWAASDWDDTELCAAFDRDKAAGNIRVAEESRPPGPWVPVGTSDVHSRLYDTNHWVAQSSLELLSESDSSQNIQVGVTAVESTGRRSKGTLYNAVYPPSPPENNTHGERPRRTGKLYQTLFASPLPEVAPAPKPNRRTSEEIDIAEALLDQEEEEINRQIDDVVRQAYKRGYDSGFSDASNGYRKSKDN